MLHEHLSSIVLYFTQFLLNSFKYIFYFIDFIYLFFPATSLKSCETLPAASFSASFMFYFFIHWFFSLAYMILFFKCIFIFCFFCLHSFSLPLSTALWVSHHYLQSTFFLKSLLPYLLIPCPCHTLLLIG